MEVRGLIENIDDLFRNSFRQKEVSLTTGGKNRMKEKLNYIEIPFDCSDRSLNSVDSSLLLKNKSSLTDNDNLNNILPSLEQTNIDSHRGPAKIANALRASRWLVILGDPGSAKTTLLRRITRIFAEAAYRRDEEMVSGEERSHFSVRIPILIRIDYVGEHTWLSERYCHDEDGNVLKELIYHGHALILLDGLDE